MPRAKYIPPPLPLSLCPSPAVARNTRTTLITHCTAATCVRAESNLHSRSTNSFRHENYLLFPIHVKRRARVITLLSLK
ncbi:hypothetical protein PUN28_020054 [Cardiocondyla obscurior]|uniref:Secreted protein n=1 Tax=Cardiocondyla obscurior TaxID=286306 RepID=A0AAW2E7F9_9HYME